MANTNGLADDVSEVPKNTSTNETIFPSPEPFDYAEIVLLSALVLIGGPMNVISFIQTLNFSSEKHCRASKRQKFFLCQKLLTGKNKNQKPHCRRCSNPTNHGVSARSVLLKLHLTAANLLIILVYGLSQICWLTTYSWRGGDFLCRLIKFFDTFCFYSTSNIVVLIAIERVSVAIFVDQPRIVLKYKEKLKLAVWIPWILATLCSLPQLFVWHTFAPYVDQFPDWEQCVTVWMARKVRTDQDRSDSATITFQETLYSGFHLALVFWVPAVIVASCYGVILIRFHRHIRKGTEEARRNQCAMSAARFRKRAASFHRSTTGLSPSPSSCCAYSGESTSSIQRSENCRDLQPQPSQHQSQLLVSEDRPRSPGLLMEVPIVVNSSQILVLQPTLKTVAIQTLARAKRRTVKTTAWILFAYIACWAPYNTLELWRYVDATAENRYLELLSNLIVLNAVVNPLIYNM